MTDLTVQVIAPITEMEKFIIKTNVKRERLGELIWEFLAERHAGQGVDASKPNLLDTYDIEFRLYIGGGRDGGDLWACKSTCGNKGLEAGLLLDVMSRLKQGQGTVKELEDGAIPKKDG